MKSPSIVYLAAPYSHTDPAVMEMRFHTINRAAGKLMRGGLFVFSPISHTHSIALDCDLPKDWKFWKGFDRAMMQMCGRVIVLKLIGWSVSIGVMAELQMARELEKPIAYMEVDK